VEAAEQGELSVDLSRLEPAGALANNGSSDEVNSFINSGNIWLVVAGLGVVIIAMIILINRVLK
jgi:hypothetical protein